MLWAEFHLAETLRASGADVLAVRLPAGANGAKQGLDDFLVSAAPDSLRELLAEAKPVKRPCASAGTGQPDAESAKAAKPAAADVLVSLALGNAAFFHDAGQVGYAAIGSKTLKVRSKAFRLWLAGLYHRQTGGKAANTESVSSALAALEGRALFDAPEQSLLSFDWRSVTETSTSTLATTRELSS